MSDERTPAATAASATLPAPVARARLPLPFWAPLGLGVLSCVTWLGAVLLNGWALASSRAPMWLWNSLHAALVLAVPALILLFMRSRRMPPRRHARVFFAVMALITLAAATPALLPYDASNPGSLIVRAPTLALGVAIAAVDPLVIERWRLNHSRDSSLAMLAGVGFGVSVIVAVATLLFTSQPAQCSGYGCELTGTLYISVCGGALTVAAIALFEAWLGYVIGAVIARADIWWDMPRLGVRARPR